MPTERTEKLCYGITKAIEACYQTSSPPVILNSLPIGWVPECCLLEGMLLLNTTPLGTHKTYADYSQFMIKRFIIPCYINREKAPCIHVIFDNPGRLSQTPKLYERKQREDSATIATAHTRDKIHGSMSIPSKWRENLINCRTCQRSLVILLSSYFLQHISKCLLHDQTFLVAGGFEGDIQDTAWYVTTTGTPQPDPEFKTMPRKRIQGYGNMSSRSQVL